MMMARDFRAAARTALQGHWKQAIIVVLVAALLGGMGVVFSPDITYRFDDASMQMGTFKEAQSMFNSAMLAVDKVVPAWLFTMLFIYQIVVFFIGAPVTLGLNLYCIDLYNGRYPGVGRLFDRMSILLKALAMRIVIAFFIFLWTLLFIIPGIVASYRYAMAPFILAENPEIGILEAIARSKALMTGNKLRLFCLQISFIGWFILGVLTCGIAYLWINPYFAMASTAFYLSLKNAEAREN